jgi:L-alanine-DL-glutamate epimerase-like enolase superfamily enzyme
VIYGMVANVSIGQLFLAGILPGLVMTFLMMLTVAYFAHKNNWGADIKFEWPRVNKAAVELAVVFAFPLVIWGGVNAGGNPAVVTLVAMVLLFAADWKFKFEAVLPIMTPVILIGGMTTGVFTPTEGAVAASIWALFLGLVWYRTLTFKMLVKVSMETIETTATVLFIVAAASIFGWLLTATRVTDMVTGVGAGLHELAMGVPPARQFSPALRGVLPGADRRHPDRDSRADARRHAARHRSGALRPHRRAEPHDRPPASAHGHGAVRACTGRPDVARADDHGDPAVAGAAPGEPAAHHLRADHFAVAPEIVLSMNTRAAEPPQGARCAPSGGREQRSCASVGAVIQQVDILQIDLAPKVTRTDAIQSFVTQETPIVRIRCDDGSVGTGYTYTIGTGGSSVVALLRDHLAPRLLGRDSSEVEAIWKDLFFATHATAVGAITSLALAAVDTALWDLRAQRAQQPLWKIAGGAQRRVPVYTTEGGWLHHPAQQLVDETLAAKAQGFRGAKMKVGKASIAEDVARLSAVRGAVGDAFEIMVDANQAFTVAEACRRAYAYRDLALGWFEEPLPAEGPGRSRRARGEGDDADRGGRVDLPSLAFPRVPRAPACTVVQVDCARIGGITPWLKVAHLAETFNLPVCPHFLMELHVSLSAAVPNGAWVEYIPQLDDVTTSRMAMADGYAIPPDTPGLGIDWDWQAIERRTSARATVS